jgi:lipooligosaccharide transport system permease protein
LVLRLFAWVSPLWHGNELARGVTLGGVGPAAMLGHLGYLLVISLAGAVAGRRYFYRRLVV